MYPLNLPDPEWTNAVFAAGAVFTVTFCVLWQLLVKMPPRRKGRK